MTTDNHARARAELEAAAQKIVRDDRRATLQVDQIIAAAETYHAALLAANPPELEWMSEAVRSGPYLLAQSAKKSSLYWAYRRENIENGTVSRRIGDRPLSIRAAMLACESHAAKQGGGE